MKVILPAYDCQPVTQSQRWAIWSYMCTCMWTHCMFYNTVVLVDAESKASAAVVYALWYTKLFRKKNCQIRFHHRPHPDIGAKIETHAKSWVVTTWVSESPNPFTWHFSILKGPNHLFCIGPKWANCDTIAGSLHIFHFNQSVTLQTRVSTAAATCLNWLTWSFAFKGPKLNVCPIHLT